MDVFILVLCWVNFMLMLGILIGNKYIKTKVAGWVIGVIIVISLLTSVFTIQQCRKDYRGNSIQQEEGQDDK